VGTVPDGKPLRRSAASRVFYSLFVTFAIAALLALGLAAFGYQQYIGQGPLTAPKVVDLRKGLRTPEIAAELADAGVISDGKVFTAAAYLTGSRGRLKAGEYEFPAGISMRDVLGQIVQGKSIVYKLTIPEGWTTEQAMERVRQNPILTGDLTLAPSEGSLFPDTYLFKRGTTRDAIVHDMMEAQQKLIDGLWEKRAPDLIVKSVNEAITLASIVEKETGKAEERPRVAAVFINRLKQGMRLQSDPTIIYGLAGGKGKLDRPLTKQDIANKTPYNTYRISGLPPGPIANPGKASLEAVLNPLVTADLYFVADGSGGHVFAETLAEHRKNVAKWREIERQRNAGEGDALDELAAEKAAGATGEETKGAPATGTQTTAPAEVDPTKASLPPAPVAEDTAALPAPPSTDSRGEKPAPPVPAPSAETKRVTEAAPIQSEPPAGAEPAKSEPVPSPIDSKPVAQAMPVPKSLPDAPAAEKPAAVSAIVAASTIPVPRIKPRLPLKPGDLIRVANRLVPIPVPKPKPR
jgi:UPF0755 protein